MRLEFEETGEATNHIPLKVLCEYFYVAAGCRMRHFAEPSIIVANHPFHCRAGACLPPLAKAKQIVFGSFRMIKPSPFTLLKNFGTAGDKPPPYSGHRGFAYPLGYDESTSFHAVARLMATACGSALK